MKFIFILMLLLITSVVRAAFNEPLKIFKISEDGNQFVFERREGDVPPFNGITIKDPSTKTILYEAKVTKCNKLSCLGVITKNLSGLRLISDEKYLHSYNEGPLKAIPEQKVAAPPPATEQEVENSFESAAFAGYGGPLGPGLKLGYYRGFSEDAFLGVNYTLVASSANQVSLSGHIISLSGIYTAKTFSPSLKLNLVAEIGMAKTELDFSALEGPGPILNESPYVIGIGGEIFYRANQLAFSAKGGLSKAGLDSQYQEGSYQYNNPYGTVLFFLELGAYYFF